MEKQMIQGINHITIAVSDLNRSLDFYVNQLHMTPHVKWRTGAYLTTANIWICLSKDEAKPSQDYSHLAFSVAAEDFPAIYQQVMAADIKQWKVNSSEGQSIYILDPDGHKLELHVGTLADRLAALKHSPYDGLEFLS